MKSIRIEIKSIQEVKGNWKLIEQCELDGDLKSTWANGWKCQAVKHELKSWKELGCRTRVLWNTNVGIILEPRSLQTKKWLAWHQVFLVIIRIKRKVWIGALLHNMVYLLVFMTKTSVITDKGQLCLQLD